MLHPGNEDIASYKILRGNGFVYNKEKILSIKQITMNILILFYILNATLLLLHEIESAYEKEWEILKLPGKITGFLFLHVPIIFLLFWGLVEIFNQSTLGLIIGITSGLGGPIPFIVHKLLMKKVGHFDKPISNVIMTLNILTGIITIILSIKYL